MIIEIVLAEADVVVVDRLDDRAVAVVLLQVEVVAPPLVGLRRADIGRHEAFRSDLFVGPVGPRLFGLAGAAFHLVEVAVRQAVLVEELPVELLDGQIQTLKIAVVLRRAGLVGPVDDAEVDVVGLRRGEPARLNSLKPTDSNSPCSPRC